MNLERKSKIDLFKDFYEAYGSGDYTDKKENVLIDTIKDVLKEEKMVPIKLTISAFGPYASTSYRF